MTEYVDNDDLDNDDDGESPAGLRRAAASAKRLKQENAKLERELAFARAGITGTDQRTSIFMRGYDGDLEPEAIRATATEAGFLQAPAPSQEDQASQQALAAQQQAQQITAPSAVAGAVALSPEAQLEQAFKEGGMAGMMSAAQGMGIPFTNDGQVAQ